MRFRVLNRAALRTAAILAAFLLVALSADARTFMWKVSRAGQSIYIVGSVHMLSADYYPLDPALENAFKESDLLVEELDFGEMAAPEAQLGMLTRGMLPGDQTLDKVVSASTYAAVSKRFGDIGMPMEPLKRFKPWLLALTLMAIEWQHAGLDPELGLDKHFYDGAQSVGKTVQGLETTDYQISRFDSMTMEQQDKMLAETLKSLDTEVANVKALAAAWKAGDGSTIENIVLKDVKSDPVMYQRLLVERNRNWLPKLEALFGRRGKAFVVVGAAHVVGPDGLLSMLRAKGYTVEQM